MPVLDGKKFAYTKAGKAKYLKTKKRKDRKKTKDKKPRGWYGQRVKELDVEFRKIREDLEQLLRNSPEIEGLLNHPIIREYEHWEQRIRRIEQSQQSLIHTQQQLDSLVRRAEIAARSLEKSQGRGAR